MEPVSNYIVALGGNPRYLSALAHLGCLIPATEDKPNYNQKGEADKNDVTNIVEKTIVENQSSYVHRNRSRNSEFSVGFSPKLLL